VHPLYGLAPSALAKPGTLQSLVAKHLALGRDRLVSVSELLSTQHPEQDSTQNPGKRKDPDLSSQLANPDSTSGGFHGQILAQTPQTTEIVHA
jgi:hypothetical protein